LEDFCSSLLGHLQTILQFPIVLDFRMFLSVDFIYYVYPCSVETSGGSILLLWSFSYSVLPFAHLRQKGGVFVSFGPGMYF
jgi:hypothetical protein